LSSNRFYRPELDALRFLAFGFVFFYHTTASISGEMVASGGINAIIAKMAAAGSYGVDIFFLLSSYLITELFLREKARTGTVHVIGFYERRVLRIWPLYFFFLTGTLVASRFTQIQFPTQAILPMFLFYGNFWLMAHKFFSPAGILWSISIEEQFYLLSPFAIRNLSRRGLIMVAVLLLVIASESRFLLLSSKAVEPQAVWYCTFSRLDPIATGILACLLLRGRSLLLPAPVRAAFALIGATILYGAAIWLHGADKHLSLTDGMLAYPAADIGALAIFMSFLGARIKWRPVTYLGQISYGLYVYHLLTLDIAKVGLLHFTGACPFWQRGAIALPLTVGLAVLSYRFLESPFLKLKGQVRPFLKTDRQLSGAASARPIDRT
jgi:peptidoglycan/LPS O-acetylase OafA/YrhL